MTKSSGWQELSSIEIDTSKTISQQEQILSSEQVKAGPVPKSSKVEPKASWSDAVFWGGIAGLLFRLGLIISSSGRGWGIILTGIGFFVGLVAWGMRPFYKPLLGVVLGFALADGANAILLHLHR